MKAFEIMISPVYTVTECDSVKNVIEKFLKYKISGLPVINKDNKVIAFISDGDIMRYIGKYENKVFNFMEYTTVVKGDEDAFDKKVQKILNLNVMEIAVKKVIKVPWNEEIENIAAILGKSQIKKLPVERDGSFLI